MGRKGCLLCGKANKKSYRYSSPKKKNNPQIDVFLFGLPFGIILDMSVVLEICALKKCSFGCSLELMFLDDGHSTAMWTIQDN